MVPSYADLRRAGLGGDMVPLDSLKSDTVDLEFIPLGIYVTGGGDVSFVAYNGIVRTVTVPDFFTLSVSIKRLRATGTTATGIHAYA